MSEFGLLLPAETLEAIARRAAALVVEQLGATAASPWMTRRQAAEYLRLPVSRLEKRRDIPHIKDGGRVLYNRAELDRFFLSEDGRA